MVCIKEITLADDLVIKPKRITVFIGPNGSGKSTILKELTQRPADNKWVTLIKYGDISISSFKNVFQNPKDGLYAFCGTLKSWEIFRKEWLRKFKVHLGKDLSISEIQSEKAAKLKEKHRHIHDTLSNHNNRKRFEGEGRLAIVRPKSFEHLSSSKPNVFMLLLHDTDLMESFQNRVHEATRFFPAIFLGDQRKLHLVFTNQKYPIEIMQSFGSESTGIYSDAIKIDDLSDGMKAYIGILLEVISNDESELFIDEPEIFLHPRLCERLGKDLAELGNELDKKIYLATHSPYILKGLNNPATQDAVQVIRLSRNGEASNAKLLETQDLSEIYTSPHLAPIGVIDCLFSERVILVEGGSDFVFYSEINRRLNECNNNGIEQALFLPVYGKQNFKHVVKILTTLGVGFAIIADKDFATGEDRKIVGVTGEMGLHKADLSQISTCLKGCEEDIDDKTHDVLKGHGIFVHKLGALEQENADWCGIPAPSDDREKSKWLWAVMESLGKADEEGYVTPKTKPGKPWELMNEISRYFS